MTSNQKFIILIIVMEVGPLGFMCLDSDEAGGNMGLLDMVVALEVLATNILVIIIIIIIGVLIMYDHHNCQLLSFILNIVMIISLQWVADYIQYFGGDPKRITIFGESAGKYYHDGDGDGYGDDDGDEFVGSAAIGHLLLSEHTWSHFAQVVSENKGVEQEFRVCLFSEFSIFCILSILLIIGLKSQGIGQSGSALASWAFDRHPVHHAKNIAAKVDFLNELL